MSQQTNTVESIQKAIDSRAEQALNSKLDDHLSHVSEFNNINFGNVRMDELFKRYGKGGKFEDITIDDAIQLIRLKFYERNFPAFQANATTKLLDDLREYQNNKDTADDDLPF